MKHDFSELKLDHVTRRFAGAGGKAFNALDELTLTVRRDFIDKLIADVPSDVPLPADKLVFAFQRWDQQVGARVGK